MPKQRATAAASTRSCPSRAGVLGLLGARPPRRNLGLHCKSRLSRAARRGAADEGGFTLIELLVAAALSIVVLGIVTSVLITTQNVQARDNEWAHVIQEARTGLAAMTHDIRQAYSINGTSENSIDFYAAIGGKSFEIDYDCTVPEEGTSLYECVRKEAEFEGGKPPASLPAKGVPIIRDVLNGTPAETHQIFKEYSPNSIAPDYVSIRLAVPAGGTLKLAGTGAYKHEVILSDGVYIRDMALGA
jgi:type II secretory pathway pseudopilin PulG